MTHEHSEHKSRKITHSLKSWVVWGLGCLFYFYEFLLQVSPNVMSTELMHDFSITSHALGVLVGIYFYSYAIMQIPGGVLMDHFGPRRLLTIATTICALSTMAFGMTHHLGMACCARLMIGFGSAFAAVGAMKLASSWFAADRFAFLTGLMVTIGTLGAIFGQTPLALLIDHCGWRQSMMILGCIGLVIAGLIYAVATDAPHEKIDHDTSASTTKESLWSSVLEVIQNKQLWLVACYGGLMYMATPVLCGLWGVPFFMFKMHLSKTSAANYSIIMLLGWAIASPLWGIFSNKIGRRKPALYIAAIGSLITSLLFLYVPITNTTIMQMLLLAFGILSAGFLPAFALAKELCNTRYVATGLSFMNMINMIGAAFAEPAIGYILDLCWQGQYKHHVRFYPMSAYHIALSFLPAGMLIALMILPYVRETYCKSQFVRA